MVEVSCIIVEHVVDRAVRRTEKILRTTVEHITWRIFYSTASLLYMVGRILYITVKQDTRKEFLWKKKCSIYRKQTCYRKDFLQNRQDFAYNSVIGRKFVRKILTKQGRTRYSIETIPRDILTTTTTRHIIRKIFYRIRNILRTTIKYYTWIILCKTGKYHKARIIPRITVEHVRKQKIFRVQEWHVL